MDISEYYMNDLKSVKGDLLTRKEEISLAQDIEAGIIAGCMRSGVDPRTVRRRSSTRFDRTALIADVMSRIEKGEDSPLTRTLDMDMDDSGLRDIERKGAKSRERMLVMNTRLVTDIAKKYHTKRMEFVDLIQEGNVFLIRAVDKFNWRCDFKFSTYAFSWIGSYIDRGLKTHDRDIRLPVYMESRIRRLHAISRELGEDADDIGTLAAAMGCTEGEVRDIMRYDRYTFTTSIDLPVGSRDDVSLGDIIVDENRQTVFEMVSEDETAAAVFSVMDSVLSDTERRVLCMTAGVGCEPQSMYNVAKSLGLSRSSVSDTVARAKRKMADGLAESKSAWRVHGHPGDAGEKS